MSSESTEAQFSGPASAEASLLVAVQDALADRPGVLPAARGLSHFGEHALGWMGAAGIGVAISFARDDVPAQTRWVQAGVGAFAAHAASVIIKRVVRRKRPHDPRIRVGVSTPSKLSFPSSHATSTTAAAILLGRAAGLPAGVLPAVVVPPMLASRLVLGVHYPSDVAAGAALGAACAVVVTRNDRLFAHLTGKWSRRARPLLRARASAPVLNLGVR